MNSFKDTRALYQRSEPLLSLPTHGTCTLLTGLDDGNLTSNIFQPCCDDAHSVGGQRASCTCIGKCETCIVQNRDKFHLVAAVCNTSSSAARPTKVPTVVALLFVLWTLVVQASASTVPYWQRPEGTLSYTGPGSFVKDLKPASAAAVGRTIARRTVNHDQTSELLGGTSIVDCPPNGHTDADEAASAAASFEARMGDSAMSIPSKLCHHAEAGSTLAQICNHSNTTIDVSPAAVRAAFDLLADTCTSRSSAGTIHTASGLQFALFAKVGVGRGSARERRIAKRCIATDAQEVTGCEDMVCDAKIKMNESGDCPNVGNQDTDGCSYYCEVRVAKYYGVPTIYDDSRYCAGNDCYLEEGESYTVEKSMSVSFGLEGAGPLESVLSAGISFGIAISESTSLTQGYTFGAEKCGWWYKAPVMLHSCGSLSEYEPNYGGDIGLSCLRDAPMRTTVPNACSEIQATAINGDDADILVIPKWVSCGDRADLPLDQNSPGWQETYGGGRDGVHAC